MDIFDAFNYRVFQKKGKKTMNIEHRVFDVLVSLTPNKSAELWHFGCVGHVKHEQSSKVKVQCPYKCCSLYHIYTFDVDVEGVLFRQQLYHWPFGSNVWRSFGFLQKSDPYSILIKY